jgi:hypothetical protein
MLDRVHKVSEIVAAFAIVSSLIFVGLQLSQNTDALKSNAAQVSAATWQDLTMEMAANEQLANIWTNSIIQLPLISEAASAVDTLRLTLICTANLKSMETNFRQWNNGNLSDDLFEAARQGFIFSLMIQPHYEAMLSGPGRSAYIPQFIDFYDESLIEAKARRSAITSGQS